MSDVLTPLDEEFGDDAPDSALLQAIRELSASNEGQIKVFRCGKNKEVSWLFNVSPSEFSLETLQQEYGGGRFRIYIHDKTGRMLTNRSISIEPPKQAAAPVQAVEAKTTQTDLAAVMLTGFQELGKLIVAARPKETSMLEMVQLLTAMKGLTEPTHVPPSSDPSQLMQLFLQGLTMGKELGTTQEPPSGMDRILDTISTMAPTFAQALATKTPAAQAVQPAVAGRINLPPPPVVQAPSFNPTIPQPVQDESTVMMKYYLGAACERAAIGAPVEPIVDVVIDNIPQNEIEQLLSLADPVAKLAEIEPKVLQHRAWFERVLKEVQAEFVEDGLTEVGVNAISPSVTFTPLDGATHVPWNSTASLEADEGDSV